MDVSSVFRFSLFCVFVVETDYRSSAISRRYRILVGAFAVIGIALSMLSLALMAKVMSGAQNYAELSTHVFEMLLTGTHLGIAWCVRILALMTCAVIAILKLNPRLRFSVMAVSSGVGLATLAWAGDRKSVG